MRSNADSAVMLWQLLQEQYFEGWPCRLQHCKNKGRYLVASKKIKGGEVVLVSDAYLSMILNSHKKRVCHYCYNDCRRRLSTACGRCHQVYYCSEACLQAHTQQELGCSNHSAKPPFAISNHAVPPASKLSFDSCESPSSPEKHIDALRKVTLKLQLTNLQDGHHSTALPQTAHPTLQSGCKSDMNGKDERVPESKEEPHRSPVKRPPRSSSMVPHGLLCAVLRQFGSVKWNSDVESVMLGVVQLLGMEAMERRFAEQRLRSCQFQPMSQPVCGQQVQKKPNQQKPGHGVDGHGPGHVERLEAANCTVCVARSTQGPFLPATGHQDFLQLVSHTDGWAEEDRADWLRFAQQLLRMLSKAGWTGRFPSLQEILSHVGRITSNNFGIYAEPVQQGAQQEVEQGGQPVTCLAAADRSPPPAPVGSAAGPAAAEGEGRQAMLYSSPPAAADVAGAGPAQRAQRAQRTAQRAQRAAQRHREELIGRELHIAASFFNHSCAPNCVVHRGWGTARISALTDIKEGEELCISYVDLGLPRPARRASLLQYFHFHCNCPRCEREAVEGSGPCSYV